MRGNIINKKLYEVELARLKEALARGMEDWQQGRIAEHSLARIKERLDRL